MKLIIDIPEDVYTRLFDNGIQDNEIAVDDICEMARALRTGIPLSEEIEKIKAEIEEEQNGWDRNANDYTFGHYKAFDIVVDILDNHISELKGENPDCRNCDKWKTCENGEKGHANGTSIGYSIGECGDYVELKGENK